MDCSYTDVGATNGSQPPSVVATHLREWTYERRARLLPPQRFVEGEGTPYLLDIKPFSNKTHLLWANLYALTFDMKNRIFVPL